MDPQWRGKITRRKALAVDEGCRLRCKCSGCWSEFKQSDLFKQDRVAGELTRGSRAGRAISGASRLAPCLRCCLCFSSLQVHNLLSSCLGLARASFLRPKFRNALSSAVDGLVDILKETSASEYADILRDQRTLELLSLIDREQAAAIVERRWRELLNEPDEKRRNELVQRVSQQEVLQITDVLLSSKDQNRVSHAREKARSHSRGASACRVRAHAHGS